MFKNKINMGCCEEDEVIYFWLNNKYILNFKLFH